jgi:hypothetical protein
MAVPSRRTPRGEDVDIFRLRVVASRSRTRVDVEEIDMDIDVLRAVFFIDEP